MLHLPTFVFIVLSLSIIQQVDGRQCYKCGCFVQPGGPTCTNEADFNCEIQYVENNYCYITRTAGDVEFGHSLNSDLIYLESLHYIRASEEIVYWKNTSVWQAPRVKQVTYGCDWNLCNSPRILSLLPSGLTYAVDSGLLTSLLVAGPGVPLASCLECDKCINSTVGMDCPSQPCSGTCFIDDHIDDPQFNTDACLVVFDSSCVVDIFNTAVTITGNYYIDDKISDITEIDIYCAKDDCNHPDIAQNIKGNVTFSTQINDQLYFRPLNDSTTPIDDHLPCYTCYCTHEISDTTQCQSLSCTIVYRNVSYCEIIRDFKEISGSEIITLGHVQKTDVRYKHSIHAEEKLILYTNQTWSPPAVDLISYICDWPLCNDPRIVSKLTTSFQFDAPSSEIAAYLQGPPGALVKCNNCSICSNATDDFEGCQSDSCSTTGACFIDQSIDDPQYNDCEYAFVADCENDISETSIFITATYNIDGDILDIDEFGVYCSVDECNKPSTVYNLTRLVQKDIHLDPLFIFRPITTTTSTTTTTTTSTTTTAATTTTSRVTSTTTTAATTTTSRVTSTTTAAATTTTTSRITLPATTSATTSQTPSPASTTTSEGDTTPSASATIFTHSLSVYLLLLFVTQAVINN